MLHLLKVSFIMQGPITLFPTNIKIYALKFHSIGTTIIDILCTISWDAQSQAPLLNMFFHHMLLSSCKGCNKCVWHFTDMIFLISKEKGKKQTMLFPNKKAIQIYLELIRAEFILPNVSFLIQKFCWLMNLTMLYFKGRKEKRTNSNFMFNIKMAKYENEIMLGLNRK